MSPETVESYRCASCGKVYLDREIAEKCCVCRTCGRPITEKTWGTATICRECWDKDFERVRREKWKRAEKVRWNEYDGVGVYIEGFCNEYFFPVPSPDELIDAWEAWEEDPFPGFGALMAWGVDAKPIAINADYIVDDLLDAAYEDYEVTPEMRADLERLCDEWNSRHGDRAYWPSNLAIVYEEES